MVEQIVSKSYGLVLVTHLTIFTMLCSLENLDFCSSIKFSIERKAYNDLKELDKKWSEGFILNMTTYWKMLLLPSLNIKFRLNKCLIVINFN